LKIAILNDTHCGIRNSSEIFINYQEKFYSEVFFPYLKEHGITQILHLGDYYDHRKFINFKAQNANRQMFLNVLKEEGIHMDIIPGNHDVFYKNTNDLCSLKELLGYYTSNVNIIMKPKVVDYDGMKMALVPWINSENYAESIQFIKSCNASILGAHLELVGFDMMKGMPNPHGMTTEVFDRFEMVLSGHFHTKSSKDNIHYLGGQMEFTWADCEDPKYFHILDTDTRELTPVRNPYTMFEKIMYNDAEIDYNSNYTLQNLDNKFVKVIVVKKTDPFMFDKFIDKVNQFSLHELKIAETFEEFIGENVDDDNISVEDTTQLLDSYIEAVDTDLDKGVIKGLMRNLYVEASTLDIV
jgi:DNA repair exonuclease SbcCD nuclease subunit